MKPFGLFVLACALLLAVTGEREARADGDLRLVPALSAPLVSQETEMVTPKVAIAMATFSDTENGPDKYRWKPTVELVFPQGGGDLPDLRFLRIKPTILVPVGRRDRPEGFRYGVMVLGSTEDSQRSTRVIDRLIIDTAALAPGTYEVLFHHEGRYSRRTTGIPGFLPILRFVSHPKTVAENAILFTVISSHRLDEAAFRIGCLNGRQISRFSDLQPEEKRRLADLFLRLNAPGIESLEGAATTDELLLQYQKLFLDSRSPLAQPGGGNTYGSSSDLDSRIAAALNAQLRPFAEQIDARFKELYQRGNGQPGGSQIGPVIPGTSETPELGPPPDGKIAATIVCLGSMADKTVIIKEADGTTIAVNATGQICRLTPGRSCFVQVCRGSLSITQWEELRRQRKLVLVSVREWTEMAVTVSGSYQINVGN